jgi:hypothetical protein
VKRTAVAQYTFAARSWQSSASCVEPPAAPLLDALDTGRVGSASLDVTDPEPLPAEHRLWSHPAVVDLEKGY